MGEGGAKVELGLLDVCEAEARSRHCAVSSDKPLTLLDNIQQHSTSLSAFLRLLSLLENVLKCSQKFSLMHGGRAVFKSRTRPIGSKIKL